MRSIIEPDLVPIPAGEFLMGDEQCMPNCQPLHRVWVDAFELATTPVTNREYAVFLEQTAHPPPPFWGEAGLSDPRQPVVGPCWFDSVAYCSWLAESCARQYRLPSEAEWEKAARGGLVGCAFPWGDELPADSRGGRDRGLRIVGTDAPNGFGLHNMSDLVHEWCLDWSARDYYQRSRYRNPVGPVAGKRRIARGGAWRHAVRHSRCGHRSSLPPDRHFNDFGFRVALGPMPPPESD